MDLHAQRLMFAINELWTSLAELRASILVVTSCDSATAAVYIEAIREVEQARRHLVDATAAMLIATPEGP